MRKQLLVFVEGLNTEHCSLFNFGRAVKLAGMHTAFPEQRPCCACVAALGREHTSASMDIKGAVKTRVPVTYPVHELVLYIFHAWFLPAENIAVLRWWVALWDLLNHLMKCSPPAYSSPALVPDDRSTAPIPLSCFDSLAENLGEWP